MHITSATALQRPLPDLDARTATLSEKEHGLTEAVLNETDVMIRRGYTPHDAIDDAVVE